MNHASVIFPRMSSSRLFLREHLPEDSELFYSLMSDSDALRYYGRNLVTTYESVLSEFEQYDSDFLQDNAIHWSIIANGSYIGSFEAWGFKSAHKRVSIGCIIEPRHRGKGYAGEALNCVLLYLFKDRGIHRVQLYVDPRNIRATSFFKKHGFKEEGRLRDYEIENENHIDIVIMSLLKREFDLMKQSI